MEKYHQGPSRHDASRSSVLEEALDKRGPRWSALGGSPEGHPPAGHSSAELGWMELASPLREGRKDPLNLYRDCMAAF